MNHQAANQAGRARDHEVGRLADATADADQFGIEDVDEAHERPAQYLAGVHEDLARNRVAGTSRH